MVSDLKIERMKEPTEEELLQEAQAWGFDSWEEYCAFVDSEYERMRNGEGS